MDKLKDQKIRFHLDKIVQLKKQMEQEKNSGEKRIWKSQLELDEKVNRIQKQIDSHQTIIYLLKEAN